MPRPKIDDLFTDHQAVLRAINKAGREAMLEHKRLGNPIADWRDGKVVIVQSEDIEIPPAVETRKTNTNAA
jgi:hypothetical protein